MTADSIDIIVHGTHCPNWPDLQTTEEWLAAQLVKDEVKSGDWLFDDDASGVWRCPFCRQAVFVFFDYGTIDFGVEEPDLIQKNSMTIELVEPIAKPADDRHSN